MGMTTGDRAPAANLAFFVSRQRSLFAEFLDAAIEQLAPARILIVTADGKSPFKPRAAGGRRGKNIPILCKAYAELSFLDVPISFGRVERQIESWLEAGEPAAATVLAIDMGWGLETNSAAANFERWTLVADRLAMRPGLHVVSLYNRSLLIDEQLLAALRGHPGILTPTGVAANPHWLPARLLTQGTLREQIDHWLGEILPDSGEMPAAAIHAAEGADPMWLLRRSAEEPVATYFDSRDRWKIRCFGRLRIYRNDGSQVNWEVSGGATRKSKTLFAYLLQRGGQGATTDELCDLLWPEADKTETARNRLYHTVKCLREALEGRPGRGTDMRRYLLRDGSRYILTPPERSWLDISTFEQLCRQSHSHIKSGASDEALICLQAADRLYTGDLFADIPADYADNSEHDWCWSKRYWLRDMFFKIQRDAARIHRERQDFSTALAHCQKALAIDPLCEMAHEEAMRVFRAQGRREAIDRQYKLYLDSVRHFDDRPQSASLRQIYQSLVSVVQPV
jgi:two-component SAPR family response regulator